MTVSRLRDIPGIGVDIIGDAADAAGDPEILRLENLDTDIRPPAVALAVTRAAIDDDAANSYLPFQGTRAALAGACERHGAWLIYDAAMERIRFDGRGPSHPAAADQRLAEHTITVGSAAKELRMIGWRVGWVTGPADIVADIRLVGLTNVV